MENMADYISHNSLERIVSDASGYVKRYPITAIAAAATVGLIAIVASQATWKGFRSKGSMKRSKTSVRSIRGPLKRNKNRQSSPSAQVH